MTGGPTRRRVLAAAGGLPGVAALAGCGLFDDEPEPAPAPDPLQPLLDESLALAGAYDRAAAARPDLAARLAPLAENHRAHAAELARMIGVTPPSAVAAPSSSASATDGDPRPDLRRREQAAHKTAAAACAAAPAARAALVGSIAAGRATHAEALR